MSKVMTNIEKLKVPDFFNNEAYYDSTKHQVLFKNIPGTLEFKDTTSQALYWTIFMLTLVACLLIYLFRRVIRQNYQNKTLIMSMRKKDFWILIGSITLTMIIARSILVLATNYPMLWEIVPLHFCRLILLFIAFSLIFNKLNWIKYYGHLGIFGALLSVFIPGIYKSVGADNFWFYDYILAHAFILLMISLMFAFTRDKYKFEDTVITVILFGSLCFAMWIINLSTASFAHNIRWRSNYFYLGKSEYNDMYSRLGWIVEWPLNLLTFTLLGILVLTLSVVLWCLTDKIHIEKQDGKIKAYIFKSEVWAYYKTTFKTAFKKNKIA
ncbi:YwaF family protein [Mycoplasmopsis felifaucium]|uniref:YwaF family protein n=1 Tax=Mycoplasmopsis felifaucium TaxID=35768 RepID=A0ABZ2RP01_9BACT